jgi:hypothetical protein
MSALAFGFLVAAACFGLLVIGMCVSLLLGAGKRSQAWAMSAPIVIVTCWGFGVLSAALAIVFA